MQNIKEIVADTMLQLIDWAKTAGKLTVDEVPILFHECVREGVMEEIRYAGLYLIFLLFDLYIVFYLVPHFIIPEYQSFFILAFVSMIVLFMILFLNKIFNAYVIMKTPRLYVIKKLSTLKMPRQWDRNQKDAV